LLLKKVFGVNAAARRIFRANALGNELVCHQAEIVDQLRFGPD